MPERFSTASEKVVSLSDRLGKSGILTVNGGSSSLKFALFDWKPSAGQDLEPVAAGRIERIGLADARAVIKAPSGGKDESMPVNAPDLGAAAEGLIDWLKRHDHITRLAAVGHRIVHGGPRYDHPERITDELVAELRRICPLDVDHLPAEIDLIERFQRLLPDVTQVACFDTAFHRDMPRVAQLIAIPRRFETAGVRRYGFHGLSYAYLMRELERLEGTRAGAGRVILAHLGSGASMAAVRDSKCIDTTMGLTPASGLVMATRCGDVDPGLPFFLAQSAGVTTEEFHRMVNHESGLLGVSETSPDLRDLLEQQPHDRLAAEAVSVFFYHAKKSIGALAAALGGLDVLVFSGGIGENSAEARARICEGLGFLGITLDAARNKAGEPVISADGSRVRVRVIRTDEEMMIASSVAGILAGPLTREAIEETR
jgi:acetate kinase